MTKEREREGLGLKPQKSAKTQDILDERNSAMEIMWDMVLLGGIAGVLIGWHVPGYFQ